MTELQQEVKPTEQAPLEGTGGTGSPPVAPTGEGEPKTPVVPRESETGQFGEGKPPKWAAQRIDQLTGKNKDLERELEAERKSRALLEKQLAERSQAPGSPPPTPALPVGDVDKEVERRLAAQTAQAQLDRMSNEIIDTGRKEFKDFEDVIGNFRHLGGMDMDTLMAVHATGQGAQVLYHLAQNLGEAQELLQKPLAAQAVELVKLAGKVAKQPAKVSEAPEPISPVGKRGSAANEELRDDLSSDEWQRIRAKQLEMKRKRA